MTKKVESQSSATKNEQNTTIAQVEAQIYMNPDEVTPSTKHQQNTVNVLERIKDKTANDLFSKWSFLDFVSLIEHTQRAIAGVNDGKYEMDTDSILEEWSSFMTYYSAAYYTREIFWGLKTTSDRAKALKFPTNSLSTS